MSDERRVRCPFYGFVCLRGLMMDNRGNACALTGEHSPCKMEMASEEPDWDMCSFYNIPENISVVTNIIHNVRAYPDELRPSSPAGGWTGIWLEEWFKECMGREYKEPREAPMPESDQSST